jgi:hypothetical protein
VCCAISQIDPTTLHALIHISSINQCVCSITPEMIRGSQCDAPFGMRQASAASRGLLEAVSLMPAYMQRATMPNKSVLLRSECTLPRRSKTPMLQQSATHSAPYCKKLFHNMVQGRKEDSPLRSRTRRGRPTRRNVLATP